MEKQYAWQTDVLKIEKINFGRNIHSTHFMLYNAG